MQLGIDIVDLRETEGHHPRFRDRALGKREKDLVNAGEPGGIWTFWAAKEAAFKAHTQKLNSPFHPSEWQVDLQKNLVIYEDRHFSLKVFAADSQVRAAVATNPDFQLHEALHEYADQPAAKAPSADVRALLQDLCQKVLGTKARLSLEGIPQLHDPDAAVSISHHGRWIYAALALAPIGMHPNSTRST